MKIEEKINHIGRMLADIQLDINFIKRNIKKIDTYLTNPDKLDFERYWKKINTQSKRKK